MSNREIRNSSVIIRDVRVQIEQVFIEGHKVEISLRYRVSEAERVYGEPWSTALDRHLQRGMSAVNRIGADETLSKAVVAKPYVVDGICCRTATIANCQEAAPGSAYLIITRADGTVVHRKPYSCVKGEPPRDHRPLVEHALKR